MAPASGIILLTSLLLYRSAAAKDPAWTGKPPAGQHHANIFVNSTYEDVVIQGVEPVSVYAPLKYNQGLQYDNWYAYPYPEFLQHLPVARPYGNISTTGNNGSTITPVHLYSDFISIKPISADFAIYIDTNSINTVPVVGKVLIKAYKREKGEKELILLSEASCAFRNLDEGHMEHCKFPKEWMDVVLLEFSVVGEGYIAQLSDLISAAQASFNLQAFLPDVIPAGTVGFLMDNFCFGHDGDREYDRGKHGH